MIAKNNYADIYRLMVYIDSIPIEGCFINSALIDTVCTSNVNIIGQRFSFGMWVTRECLTIHEYCFNKVPKRCLFLKDIDTIEYDNNVITIHTNNEEDTIIDLLKLEN